MKYSISKNKNYEFKGTVELSFKDNALLEHYTGITLNEGDTFTLDMHGQYIVAWDDDIAMPQVTDLTFSFEANTFEVDIDLIDLEPLDQAIEKSGDLSDWYADKRAHEIDDAMDRYEDR